MLQAGAPGDNKSFMKRRAILFLLAAVAACAATTPVRRLNRYEYNCTVRDLLGVDFRPGPDFPADNFTYGFDNNADTLTVTPALLAKYLDDAKKIARAAAEPVPPPAAPELDRYSNASASPDLTWQRRFTWDGDYNARIALAGRSGPAAISVTLDEGEPRQLSVSVNFEGRRYADTRFNVAAGIHRLRAYAPGDYPEYVELRGPYGLVFPALPAGYRLVFSCGHAPGQHTALCLRGNLENLARRAWRRPVTAQEIDRLMRLAAQPGANLQQQMETALEAILVSPSFLFRVENGGNEFDLASRLSYFLWSGMPDAELFSAAQRGHLADSAVLAEQTRRMLKDPRSDALAENFAAQWLEFRNLDGIHRDPARFPEFTADLRDAMRRETELFVEHVIREDRSVLDFLNAKYTFANELLAKLYGIAGVTGDRFRRVDLIGTPRTGVLTQASVLTVTSYSTRTSPVLRGKWILENILNEPPPPPPANVAALRDPSPESGQSLREQLEQHRANPECAGCHARMDPLGFSLENFDAIGRWHPLAGSAASGTPELAAELAKRPAAFAECLTEKLLTFALGRGLRPEDLAAAHQISEAAAANNYRFSDLVLGVVSRVAHE